MIKWNIGYSRRSWMVAALLLLTATTAQPQTIQNEIAKLLASDGAAGNAFGWSVAVSEDIAVIGAEFDDDNGFESGSAYVYVRDGGGSWTEQAKLLASDGGIDEGFGYSVAVSGDTAVIGAGFDDDNGFESGSAYVYVRDGSGNWTEQAKLLASDGGVGDGFGRSVAVIGDTAVIGASGDDDNGFSSGAAYVYVRDGSGNWTEQAKLLASDGAPVDRFGRSVAVSGDTAVIGAELADDNGFESGSAYVYVRDGGGSWTEQAKLLASSGGPFDFFGGSVAVSGDTVVIGASESDETSSTNGSAYVYVRDGGGNWTEQAKLLASDGAVQDAFGDSVAVAGDTAVIGARLDGFGSGSAYVYVRDGSGNWTEQAKLLASDGAAGGAFGWSVAVTGDTAVIGARWDDDNGSGSGSAYVFDLLGGPISRLPRLYCPGDLTGDGVAELVLVRPTGEVRVKNLNGSWVKGFRLTRLSGVVDAEIAPDSNGNGVPELVAIDGAGSEVRDLLSGEHLASSNFSQIDDALDLVLLADRTGDGVVDASILGASPVRVQVGDSQSWAGRQTLTFDNYMSPKDLQVYPDLNANGVPEIGVLGENNNSDGSDKIELRDMSTGTKVTDLWVGRGWQVVSHLLLGDLNGNGSGEAAILRLSDKDQIAVTLRDSRTKQWLGTRFFDPQYPPIKLLSLEDINSNGADEIVVFGQRFNRGNQKAQVMDAATGEILKAVFYDKSFHGQDMAVCEDLNGNGVAELAMLGERPSDGKLRVIVKDALTGERLGVANF